MKKAIILAGGSGLRIRKYHNKPKALLEFGNNKIIIIERLYYILKKKNFSEIIIITGFKHRLLKKSYTKRKLNLFLSIQ